jgi:hypothetical protein
MLDLVVARIWNSLEQLARHHDEARRAETALEPGLIEKSLLDRIERVAVGEALDRFHLAAVEKRREQQAP